MITLKIAFVIVFAVIPNHQPMTMFHAVFKFSYIFGALFLYKLAFSVLLAIYPLTDVNMSTTVLEQSLTVKFIVTYFPFLFWAIVVNHLTLTSLFSRHYLIFVESLYTKLLSSSFGLWVVNNFFGAVVVVEEVVYRLMHFFNFWLQINLAVIAFHLHEQFLVQFEQFILICHIFIIIISFISFIFLLICFLRSKFGSFF